MPKFPKPLALVFGLIAVALVVRTVPRDRGVIIDHLEFGRRVIAGEDPYATFATDRRNEGPLHTPYPPSYGVFMAPFAVLPEVVARAAWALLQVAALWGLGWALLWWHHRVARPGTDPPRPRLRIAAPWILVAVATLLSRYILRDTHGGGGNGINAALAFCGFTLAEAGRARSAGILIGLSIATKPTQLLFVALLLVCRRYRAAGWVLVCAGAMALAAWASVGSGPWRHWAEGSWAYGSVVDIYAPPSHGFPPFTWMNQCLRCAIYRVAGTVPEPFVEELGGMAQGAGWALQTVSTLARGANLFLGIATFALIWRGRHSARGRWLGAALLITLSLLVSPISWKAHHVALAPAMFVLLAHGGRTTWWVLALYLPTCAIGEELLGKELKNRMQSWYLVTVWDLVLWGAIAALLWRAGRAPRAIE